MGGHGVTGRIVLLVTSPRLPAGVLTLAAWDTLRRYPVFAGAAHPQAVAVRAAGIPVRHSTDPVADLLAAGDAVWLVGPAGDAELARELGLRLVREPGRAELELLYGSWDPAGARLLDVVAAIDRLASPGGDPWKRAQTHQSLARFLLEEAYEAVDAIAAGDPVALREELGDVLLQVVLHARLAQQGSTPYTVDDVAGDLYDKLVRRNPHVFGDAGAMEDLAEIVEQWEQIKKAEKARLSTLDGIAWAQPALSLAEKVIVRAGRAGVAPPVPVGHDLGARLLRAVDAAVVAGQDAEAELRAAVLAYAQRVRAAEADAQPPA